MIAASRIIALEEQEALRDAFVASLRTEVMVGARPAEQIADALLAP